MPRVPPEGKRFKKGQSGNPKGAATHNPVLKAVRRMTQADVAEVGQLILEGNLEKLRAVKEDNGASVLKVWFCSIAIKAITKGDAQALSVILDRIIGKCNAKIELTGRDGGAVKIEFTAEQKKKIAKAYLDE